MESIFTRRTIRRYTPQPVTEEQLEMLLRAAMAAPSAENQQPWHFIVITDKDILSSLVDIHDYGQIASHAPAAILVCGDETVEKMPGFWVQDCSAAAQNILLSACSLGLGAAWLGIYPLAERVRAFQARFSLPAGVIPLAVISVGYPAEEKPPADRYVAARVHRNQW